MRLSTTYKILSGDTLGKISKKTWGTEIHSDHIVRSNPGLQQPLTVGTNIVLPDLPNYPGDLPRILGISGENNVQVYIDGTRFEFWSSISIKRSIDSIDVMSFVAPFEFDSPGYVEIFKPFSYKSLSIYIGDKLLITGVIISIHPQLNIDGNIVTISGYSLPGVLQDCTAPASSFSLEFNKVGLLDIARAVSKPFGLSVLPIADDGDVFDKVAMKPTEKVYDFLTDLAKQRNLVITSTPTGDIKFWKSNVDGNIVADLETGKAPLLSIDAKFNEQNYYSHITGISFVSTGVPGAQYTDKNPYLPGTIRPFTFGATDTDNINIKTAVNAKTGRMFANMLTYTIKVSSWRDKVGDLWEPNTIVQVFAPQVMIYIKYRFIIRSVEFSKNDNSETAILELIPPEGFNGKIPKELPWVL